MKTLTLLRHAKSTWDDPAMKDVDRPLNRRGRAAARAMGAEMRRLGLAFDAVIASPAKRVVETLEGLNEAYGGSLAAMQERRAYLAPVSCLLDIVHAADDAHDRLLLMGHNPGFELFALALTEGDAGAARAIVAEKYPTGALAEIELAIDHWREAAPGAGRLVRFLRPRDLDPALGPDAVEGV